MLEWSPPQKWWRGKRAALHVRVGGVNGDLFGKYDRADVGGSGHGRAGGDAMAELGEGDATNGIDLEDHGKDGVKLMERGRMDFRNWQSAM